MILNNSTARTALTETEPTDSEERFFWNLSKLISLLRDDQLPENLRSTCFDIEYVVDNLQLNRYLLRQNPALSQEYRATISSEMTRIPALLNELLSGLGWKGASESTPQLPISAWLDLTIHALTGYNQLA